VAFDVRPDEREDVSPASNDTIFALSSGPPPAAIAIIRISGSEAYAAVQQLVGDMPEPRRAALRTLRDADGAVLDSALVLLFDPPATATGEAVAELHVHGGRAVVAAVAAALEAIPRLRAAEPGEFTRRAFENGRIDLAEAEGLADLLAAETESQRRSALALAGGALSRLVDDWQGQILVLAAAVEAALDFGDEGDVAEPLSAEWHARLNELQQEMESHLSRPPAERLRDGVRVVLAGPPNVGKSSLFNAIVEREAAIVSPLAGTTRDVIEAPVAISGVPFVFIDTAGLRDGQDEIEEIGISRSHASLAVADLILWLGEAEQAPAGDNVILVASKSDLTHNSPSHGIAVSARTGSGMTELLQVVTAEANSLLPKQGEVHLNERHRKLLKDALLGLSDASNADPLVAAEGLRRARGTLDAITGRAGVEDMLDSLFGRFCIGK
jgi:tRNA modification GTPase